MYGVELTQAGFIKRILESIEIEGGSPKATPAEAVGLRTDIPGSVLEPSFSYVSIIGMLQYLQ